MFTSLRPSQALTLVLLCFLDGSYAQTSSGSLNGNVPASRPGDVGSDSSAGATEGAQGADSSGVHLSTGATVAIAIVAIVAVVAGVTMSVLFFIAKKRQWTMRDTIRRSVKRAGTAIKTAVTPRLPKKMTLPPIQEHHSTHFDSKTELTRPQQYSSRPKRDIESGFINLESTSDEDSSHSKRYGVRKEKPAKLDFSQPQSKRNAPAAVPQTPGWAKIFGR